MTLALLFMACGAVTLASWLGGAFSSRAWLTESRRRLLLGFVAGLLLGLAMLHLLPHALEELHHPEQAMVWAMAGFLILFALQRVFPAPDGHGAAEPTSTPKPAAGSPVRHLSWWGALAGLSLHSLLDGFALATATLSAHLHGPGAALGLLLAVLLHKPFDALSLIALMRRAGVSARGVACANLGFALVAPIGALVFAFGLSGLGAAGAVWEGRALALCAGMFLCIAACELLPELPFERRPRLRLWGALAAGLVLPVLFRAWEHAGHDHDAARPRPAGAHHADVQYPSFREATGPVAMPDSPAVSRQARTGQCRGIAG
jgi:zinc and cadmium transporter